MGNEKVSTSYETKLQALQQLADTKANRKEENRNGIVDTEKEINIFHKLVTKQYENKEIDDATYLKLMGVTFTIKSEQEEQEETEKAVAAESLAKTTVDNMYDQERKKFDNQNLTNEEVMKLVKKQLKDKDQYEDEVKDAFKEKKAALYADARATVAEIISTIDNETNRKEIAKQVKAQLKESGQWDEYTEEALKQTKWHDVFTGKKRFGKIETTRQADANNIEDKKVQTAEEIQDFVEDHNELYSALIKSGLATINNNGEVDLSELSQIISDHVGVDHTLSRHAKKDKAVSEKYNLKAILEAEKELGELSNSDLKRLVKLTGHRVEGKDIRKIVFGALKGFVGAAGIAGTAAAMSQPNDVIIKGDQINHNTNVTIKNGTITGVLPDGFEVSKNGADLVLKISQIITQPDKLVEAANIVSPVAWKAGLIGAGLEALRSLEDKGEESILPTKVEQENLAGYIKYAEYMLKENDKSEYLPAVTCIASAFIKEDGTWDRTGYEDYINKLAGKGSLWNANEVPATCKEEETEDVQEDVHTYNQYDQWGSLPKIVTYNINVDTIDATDSSWGKLAEQYECLNKIAIPTEHKNCTKRKDELPVRMLKVAQAITDNNYSSERLLKLAEMTFASPNSKYENLKNFPGIDYETLVNVMNAELMSDSVKMPAKLADCNRVVKNTKATIEDKTGKKAGVKAAQDKGRIIIGNFVPSKFYAKLDNTWYSYDNMKDRDDAITAFRKKYPNATIEKK